MKKTLKGELLVETAVAMTIFALIMATSFKAFKSITSITSRKSEYEFFESVCLDIDKYYDNLGKKYWARNYFGDCYSPSMFQLYDEHFQLIDTGEPVYSYILKYSYNKDNPDILQVVVLRYSDGYELEYDVGYQTFVEGEEEYQEEIGLTRLSKPIDKTVVKVSFGESEADSIKDQEFYSSVLDHNSNIPVVRIRKHDEDNNNE